MYKNYGKISSLGRSYMPIGSCVLIRVSPNMFIASAPTMWLPQDIRGTNNVYYATMAVLKNVLSRVQENDVEIIEPEGFKGNILPKIIDNKTKI